MNSAAELDMWSDIRVDVRTPLAILRIQENLLAKKTRGILQAIVASNYLAEQSVQHQLDLFAPALGYRETLLTAKHAIDLVYPVTVTAKGINSNTAVGGVRPFRGAELSAAIGGDLASDQRRAPTEEEFVALVRQVLGSPEVRGIMQSLIARSNELRPAEPTEENSSSEGEAPPPSAGNEENH